MKRRTTALLLLLALLLPLAGCGKTETAVESGLAETPGSDKAQSGDKGKPQTGKNGTSQAGGAEQDDLLAPITSGDEPKAGLIPDAAIPMGDDLRWLDLAVCGHSLFWCAGGKVYRLDAPERSGEAWGKEGALFFDGFYVTKLASDGERLALCSSDGTVKLGTPSGMGFSDASDFSLPIPAGCMTSGLVLAEDTIVFLWREGENGPDRLGFFRLSNGDFIEDTPMENGSCLLSYGGGSLIYVCWTSTTAISTTLLYSFDVKSMKRGAVFPVPSEERYNAIGFNTSANRLCALDSSAGAGGSYLRVWNPENPEDSARAEPHDSIRLLPTKLLFLDGAAVVLKPAEGVIAVCGDYLSERGVVTVLVPETNGIIQDTLGHIAYVLKRDHGVKLTVKKMKEEAINTKLLAQDDDFDLYFANGRLLNLNYPVWEPLENYPLIKEQVALLFDDIVRICSADGHIFGLPFSMQLSNCFLPWNESVASACGVEKPKPGWTLEDYTELAKKVRERGYYAGSSVTAVGLVEYMWSYFDPFGTGTLNDDGTVLRKYLLWEKELYDGGLLYSGSPSEAEASGKVLFSGSTPMTSLIYGSSSAFVTRPTFDGEERYSDISSFLLMNPRSLHKEAASAVLAEMIDPANRLYTNPKQSVYYYRDFELYTFDFSWNAEEYLDAASSPEERAEREAKLAADAEANREQAIRSGSYVDIWNMDDQTKQRYAFYLHVMAHYRLGRTYQTDWLDFAAAEEKRYLNNEQDLDYTVKRIIDRAKMVLNG